MGAQQSLNSYPAPLTSLPIQKKTQRVRHKLSRRGCSTKLSRGGYCGRLGRGSSKFSDTESNTSRQDGLSSRRSRSEEKSCCSVQKLKQLSKHYRSSSGSPRYSLSSSLYSKSLASCYAKKTNFPPRASKPQLQKTLSAPHIQESLFSSTSRSTLSHSCSSTYTSHESTSISSSGTRSTSLSNTASSIAHSSLAKSQKLFSTSSILQHTASASTTDNTPPETTIFSKATPRMNSCSRADTYSNQRLQNELLSQGAAPAYTNLTLPGGRRMASLSNPIQCPMYNPTQEPRIDGQSFSPSFINNGSLMQRRQYVIHRNQHASNTPFTVEETKPSQQHNNDHVITSQDDIAALLQRMQDVRYTAPNAFTMPRHVSETITSSPTTLREKLGSPPLTKTNSLPKNLENQSSSSLINDNHDKQITNRTLDYEEEEEEEEEEYNKYQNDKIKNDSYTKLAKMLIPDEQQSSTKKELERGVGRILLSLAQVIREDNNQLKETKNLSPLLITSEEKEENGMKNEEGSTISTTEEAGHSKPKLIKRHYQQLNKKNNKLNNNNDHNHSVSSKKPFITTDMTYNFLKSTTSFKNKKDNRQLERQCRSNSPKPQSAVHQKLQRKLSLDPSPLASVIRGRPHKTISSSSSSLKRNPSYETPKTSQNHNNIRSRSLSPLKPTVRKSIFSSSTVRKNDDNNNNLKYNNLYMLRNVSSVQENHYKITSIVEATQRIRDQKKEIAYLKSQILKLSDSLLETESKMTNALTMQNGIEEKGYELEQQLEMSQQLASSQRNEIKKTKIVLTSSVDRLKHIIDMLKKKLALTESKNTSAEIQLNEERLKAQALERQNRRYLNTLRNLKSSTMLLNNNNNNNHDISHDSLCSEDNNNNNNSYLEPHITLSSNDTDDDNERILNPHYNKNQSSSIIASPIITASVTTTSSLDRSSMVRCMTPLTSSSTRPFLQNQELKKENNLTTTSSPLRYMNNQSLLSLYKGVTCNTTTDPAPCPQSPLSGASLLRTNEFNNIFGTKLSTVTPLLSKKFFDHNNHISNGFDTSLPSLKLNGTEELSTPLSVSNPMLLSTN